MARIPLTSGYRVCPEGTYIFTVSNVEYDEEFGTLRIFFEADGGIKHDERYNLIGSDGEPNEKAMNAFSFLAKTILNDFDAVDVDPVVDLVGNEIEATVTHTEGTSKTGAKRTYAHLSDIKPVE